MKIIVISILAIVLVIGGYVFIQNKKNKKELSNIEKSEFVDSVNVIDSNKNASKIKVLRTNGAWNIVSPNEYTINPDSLVFEFTGYKVGGQHVGTFNTMSADILLDTEGSPVGANFVFEPTSVKTDSSGVDKHLQAPEFFDTTAYPQITVAIKEIRNVAPDEFQAITNLTMKGVTKTLAIPVKITPTKSGMNFAVDTRIVISDYNIAYGPVQDEVRIVLGAELYKK